MVVVGGPQSECSVCPNPLCQFIQVKKFSSGWWVGSQWNIINNNVRVLCMISEWEQADDNLLCTLPSAGRPL